MADLTDMIRTQELEAPATVRRKRVRAATSSQPGLMVPLSAAWLHREDRVSRGRMNVKVEMAETGLPLMNAVHCKVSAYLVPMLAFERFEKSMDQLNRSYSKQPQVEGGTVTPFFETHPYPSNAPFHRTLGIHGAPSSEINSVYREAYNVIVGHRYRARSPMLEAYAPPINSNNLAATFWKNSAFDHIVPSFDQASIDGEVELNLAGTVPVTGLGVGVGSAKAPTGANFMEADGTQRWVPGNDSIALQWESSDTRLRIDPTTYVPQLQAELSQSGIKLSLSNIELAKKTATFARLREKFDGVGDDWIIDQLMSGIRMPDAAMAQPVLLDTKSAVFGYNRRYATDAANLEASVTDGETMVQLNFRTPAINPGGVIMVIAEIVPEQLWERQSDPILEVTDPDQLPETIRDYLDPEKVAVVPNKYVDVRHSNPDGVFGYAPLNHEWNEDRPNIGGKFFRVPGDPFNEDRQRIWSAETEDPGLGPDFYLATSLHQKVFSDQVSDPFEFTTIGELEIIGRTQFGKGLQEDTGDFDALTQQVDTTRVDQTDTTV